MRPVSQPRPNFNSRSGAATLDYVLVLGAMLPVAGMVLYYSVRAIKAVFEFSAAYISWPFM